MRDTPFPALEAEVRQAPVKDKRMVRRPALNYGQIAFALMVGLIVITNLRLIYITSQLSHQLRLLTTARTDLVPDTVVEVDIAGAATRGSADAPVQIVEYADFQCPYCASARDVLTRVLEAYEGKVVLAARHFPLPSHSQAMPAAEASECAREQGKFWEMSDLLYDNQDRLSEDVYQDFANQLGLDLPQFGTCMSEHRYEKAIRADYEAGQSYGVRGTPTFFINGHFLMSAGFEAFQKLIESELASQQTQ